jgi:hypothetical protein
VSAPRSLPNRTEVGASVYVFDFCVAGRRILTAATATVI